MYCTIERYVHHTELIFDKLFRNDNVCIDTYCTEMYINFELCVYYTLNRYALYY